MVFYVLVDNGQEGQKIFDMSTVSIYFTSHGCQGKGKGIVYIDVDAFYEVAIEISGNNMILNAKMKAVKTGNTKPGFALDLVIKDLELARSLCQENELPNFTLNTALQLYRLSRRKGAGKEDSSSVIKVVREEYKK